MRCILEKFEISQGFNGDIISYLTNVFFIYLVENTTTFF